uniref:Uncharacterized protein n=1 Tax=Eptatretus burgeri TaxID=7764 RepID=A0A8C4QBA6_EPTBU
MEPVPVAGPERLNPFEERGMVEAEPVARHEIVLTNKPVCDLACPWCVQVMQRSHEARLKMLRLGIFNDIQAVVDVAKGM